MSAKAYRVALLAVRELADNPEAVRRIVAAALEDEAPESGTIRVSRSAWTVEERREYERQKKARQRGSVPTVPVRGDMTGTNVPTDGDKNGDISGDNGDTSRALRLSGPPVNSNSSEKETENSRTGNAREAVSPGTVPADVPTGTRERGQSGTWTHGTVEPAPALRTIDPSLKLTDEARAAAQMAGVQDVEAAWTGFVGHMVSTGRRSADFVRGEWPKWYAKARTYEARDRANGTARASMPVQPAAAPGKRAWKVGGWQPEEAKK